MNLMKTNPMPLKMAGQNQLRMVRDSQTPEMAKPRTSSAACLSIAPVFVAFWWVKILQALDAVGSRTRQAEKGHLLHMFQCSHYHLLPRG
ncbi:unnamed protein product [Caretta caretta]